mgnify:CR=1 FL=1
MGLLGIPLEFLIFGATLAVVASFHDWALRAALIGLGATILYKLVAPGEAVPAITFGSGRLAVSLLVAAAAIVYFIVRMGG